MMDAQPAHKGGEGSASGLRLVYERASVVAGRAHLNYLEDQLFRADAAKLDQAAPNGCRRAAGSTSLHRSSGLQVVRSCQWTGAG